MRNLSTLLLGVLAMVACSSTPSEAAAPRPFGLRFGQSISRSFKAKYKCEKVASDKFGDVLGCMSAPKPVKSHVSVYLLVLNKKGKLAKVIGMQQVGSWTDADVNCSYFIRQLKSKYGDPISMSGERFDWKANGVDIWVSRHRTDTVARSQITYEHIKLIGEMDKARAASSISSF